jgi:preprotein translocase subunit YajC
MSAVMLAIYVIVFGGLFYFLLFLPQRRRRRETQDLLSKLSPGDEVVTASGIYGTVTEVEDGGTILLEVAENTDIRVAKGAIAKILRDEPASASSPSTPASE